MTRHGEAAERLPVRFQFKSSAGIVLCYSPASMTTDPNSGEIVRQIYERVGDFLRRGYRPDLEVWSNPDGRTSILAPRASHSTSARCLFSIFARQEERITSKSELNAAGL